VLLALGRVELQVFVPTRRLRVGAMVAAGVVGVIAIAGLVGNRSMSQAQSDLATNDWTAALSRARTASTWQPWSPQPNLVMGDAELGLGSSTAALGDYEKAARLDPNSEAAWAAVANLATGRERTTAQAQLRRLDPLAPKPQQG